MKQIKYVIALGLFFLSADILGQGAEKEQLTVALSNPGKPYKLKVGLITGSIKVTGHAADNITIDVVIEEDKINKKKEQPESGLKRIGGSAGYEVTASEKNNEVSVRTSMINRKIDLDLKVPQNVTLVLSTVNQGDILVTNVKGNLELSNVNGDIKLTGISGSAVANTVNGDITASFISVISDKPMAYSSFNGDVNITFPASTKANLKLKTDQGDIYSDFDMVVDKPAGGGTSKTNTGGTYKISKDAWVNGKINGGGPEVMVKSWAGDLYIRKAK